MNNDLRKKIVELVCKAKEGHIPSTFSIVDIISTLYKNVLKVNPKNPNWEDRDYFILSKGHGGLALFVVLHKYGFLTDEQLESYSTLGSILGGHPDVTKVPGAEASTGSLGHGLSFSLGIALGHKINKAENRVFTLIGDGESQEGTIWEAAQVGVNLKLGNLCIIVDNNQSAAQLMPLQNPAKRWEAFGWNVFEIDGHDEQELINIINKIDFKGNIPSVIIANTIKGKGVKMTEGHGQWHHKIPNKEEYKILMEELSGKN
ncbi:MAG: transketolase [Aliarcobacter sp.]|nr:transketolase [Aliarcobacter sp.]